MLNALPPGAQNLIVENNYSKMGKHIELPGFAQMSEIKYIFWLGLFLAKRRLSLGDHVFQMCVNKIKLFNESL